MLSHANKHQHHFPSIGLIQVYDSEEVLGLGSPPLHLGIYANWGSHCFNLIFYNILSKWNRFVALNETVVHLHYPKGIVSMY